MREPAKLERKRGKVFRKIANISSTSGTMGNPGQANYAVGKSGVAGFTNALAKEWGPLKVNVNAIAFGRIGTRLTARKSLKNTMELDGESVQLGISERMLTLAPRLSRSVVRGPV